MTTTILGLGNEILRDDGIGPAVIRELKKSVMPPNIRLETTGLSGVPLLDLVTGCDTLIVVDATTGDRIPGEMAWEPAEKFAAQGSAANQHTLDLFRVLELGKQLGMEMPATIKVLTIGAKDVTSFGQYLSPEVVPAISKAAAEIKKLINNNKKEKQAAGF